MMNKVYLVGGGPGDKGLITVKGMECVNKADVIIYDRLINTDIFSDVKESCELIYVGKESSNHIVPQDEINNIIVEKASQGKTVVRLKGGDPYVFGRGGEEAEWLYDRGIEFEIVPGVTSAIGGLCYAGIPVTHRDYASSFHVVTGHSKRNCDLEINWKALSEEKGTVVFLMGISNIKNITGELMKNGRNPKTPVAFVSWATRHNQKTILSTLEDAHLCVVNKEVVPPAIFVVGEVVNLSEKLGFFIRKPLFGKTIGVTRTREMASRLKLNLEELGARVIEIPTIKISKKEDSGEFLKTIENIDEYGYLAFTSQYSVKYFFDLMKNYKIDTRSLSNVKICSIGDSTSSALENYGIYPEIISEQKYGESLAEAIINNHNNLCCGLDCSKTPKGVLYPCSEIAKDSFEKELLENNIKVCRLEIYTNTTNLDIEDRLVSLLENKELDFITFTSSSTVKYLCEILGCRKDELMKDVLKVSIGDITSETALELGLKDIIQANEPSIESIIEAIIDSKNN